MERRRFPRQDVRGTALRATLVLTGGSLLDNNSSRTVEIDAHPFDLSRGGMCVSLGLVAHWTTISREKEIDLVLASGGERKPLKARVVWLEKGDQILGLEFRTPLQDAARFLLPAELR